MSTERVLQEHDRIPTRRLGAYAVLALVLTAIAIAASAWLGRGADRDPRGAPLRTAGTVERTLFDTPARTARGNAVRDAQTTALSRYRWVDRDAGVAEIPIDRAIDLVVEGGAR